MVSKTLFRSTIGRGSRLLRRFDLIEDAKCLEEQLVSNELFENEFEAVAGKVVGVVHAPSFITAGVMVASHVVAHKAPKYLRE